MKLVTSISAPYIDALVERFFAEWKQFYKSLNRLERKQVRIYLNYRKNPNREAGWSFLPSTESIVLEVNDKAKKFYLKIRYQQLSLF
jgi:hypothetical protein